MRLPVITLLLLAFLPVAARAQVVGVVLDSGGRPIAAAAVELWAGDRRVAVHAAGEDGRFAFGAEEADQATGLLARHPGYRPLSVRLGPYGCCESAAPSRSSRRCSRETRSRKRTATAAEIRGAIRRPGRAPARTRSGARLVATSGRVDPWSGWGEPSPVVLASPVRASHCVMNAKETIKDWKCAPPRCILPMTGTATHKCAAANPSVVWSRVVR